MGDCIESPNYPNPYDNLQSCTIVASRATHLAVEAFDVEFSWDTLTVNGIPYSGTTGPAGVVATGVIEWASDYSVTRGGWRVCDSGMEPTTTSPPPATGTWSLVSGPCVETGNCISSSGHPSNYGNGESCEISIDGAVQLDVQAFDTESGYDRLLVNGQIYQGNNGPQNVVATGSINWNSDSSVTKSGWKICTVSQDAQPVAEMLEARTEGGAHIHRHTGSKYESYFEAN